MRVSLKFHVMNSIYWGAPSIHYPARGQAPEIYASLVKELEVCKASKYAMILICKLIINDNYDQIIFFTTYNYVPYLVELYKL